MVNKYYKKQRHFDSQSLTSSPTSRDGATIPCGHSSSPTTTTTTPTPHATTTAHHSTGRRRNFRPVPVLHNQTVKVP